MTRNQYVQKFASELRGFDTSQQQDILQEIEGLITESGCSDDDLIERFGTPEQLAISYGKTPSEPKSSIVSGIAKKFILGVGIVTLLLVATAAYFYWSYGADEFDYSDSTHPKLTLGSTDWKNFNLDPSTEFDIKQARAIFYWHDKDHVSWKCADTDATDIASSLAIESNHCFILLPPKPVKIVSEQAQIVLVGASSNIELDIYQTEVRIAPNGKPFQLNVEKTQTHVDAFEQSESPMSIITIKAKQANIKHYEY